MALSAVERTPVEVWWLILEGAVDSPLLPFTEGGTLSTDLIENVDLFSANCRKYRVYRVVTQATVERLRLVCGTWAKLLQRNASELALIEFGSYQPIIEIENQRVKRVDIWGDRTCICEGSDQKRKCPFRQDFDKWWGRGNALEYAKYLHNYLRDVKILSLDWLMTSSLHFFTPLSNLVALSIFCDQVKYTWRLEALSDYTPRLSHLHLQKLRERSPFLSETFTHLDLHYLSVEFEASSREFQPEKFMDWTFQSLRTLVIQGSVQISCGEFVKTFISRHSGGLIGLDVTYHCDGSGYIPPNMREGFPNIQTFGTSTRNLLEKGGKGDEPLGKEPRTEIYPPVELLIHGFHGPQIDYSGLTSSLQGLRSRWHITKIISADSWGEKSSHGLKAFIERFDGEDIAIVDNRNISLQEALTAQ
ncbi:hypothetical protein CPB86DRAFT_827576 [Serendipita vermifera]|nr:hypothetical protein CPB86DRAFT_827576 [Serendipita vermifera]